MLTVVLWRSWGQVLPPYPVGAYVKSMSIVLYQNVFLVIMQHEIGTGCHWSIMQFDWISGIGYLYTANWMK